MKSILLAATVLLTVISCAQTVQKEEFIIEGNVGTLPERVDMVHYSYKLNGQKVVDSARVVNGKYILKGTMDETNMLLTNASYADTSIKYDYQRDYNVLYVAPGTKATVAHEGKFSSAIVRGSFAHDEYLKIEPFLMKGQLDVIPKYIENNPNSPMAVLLLTNFYIGPFIDAEKHGPLYELLSDENKETPSGKALKHRIKTAETVAIGKLAPEFSQKDSTGEFISLKSFKGQYVLVEFWASWCTPCRRENPVLVDIYNKYRSKNFTIFGVSVDTNRQAWLQAVRKDGLPWINTADLLDMEENPAAIAYGIAAIPQNFLLNPKGEIIAMNLQGDRLANALESLLSK